MRKLLIIALLLLPAQTFAATTYTRIPSGDTIASPVSFYFAHDSADEWPDGTYTGTYWTIYVDHNGPDISYYDECISTSELAHIFTIALPSGTVYGPVYLNVAQSLADCQDTNAEGNNQPILEASFAAFSVIDAPQGSAVSISPTLGANIGQNVTGQLGDLGTISIIAIAAGIPLAFYAINAIIGTVSKRAKK
jgi:hypothetical protein